MEPSASSSDDRKPIEANPKRENEDENGQSTPRIDGERSNSGDALAKALSTMLSSVIRDFDLKAEETFKSQDHLCSSINRLTRELDQLLEDAPFPFIMQHAAKISAVRKRVSSLNFLLKSIQRRLDDLDRLLTVGLPRGKDSSNA